METTKCAVCGEDIVVDKDGNIHHTSGTMASLVKHIDEGK